MRNKIFVILGICYVAINPLLIYLKVGFWLFIPQIISITVGIVFFTLSSNEFKKINILKLIIGLLPMTFFLTSLYLPNKQVSYKLKSNPKNYVIILFNQENGRKLDASFTEITFDIPKGGILLIKDDAPSKIEIGNFYDKNGKKLKILDWEYFGLGGDCPNHKDNYNINAISFRLENVSKMENDKIIDIIRERACNNKN